MKPAETLLSFQFLLRIGSGGILDAVKRVELGPQPELAGNRHT